MQHHGQVREDEHVGDNVGSPEAALLDALELLIPARGREKVDDAQEQVDGGKEAGEGNLGEELCGKQRGVYAQAIGRVQVAASHDDRKVDTDTDDGREHTGLCHARTSVSQGVARVWLELQRAY